jgi:hypothetical protein
MQVNEIPKYDTSDNPTGCCPRFQPAAWDGQELRFEGKLFVRASTISALHVPLNMGSVFARTQRAIEQAHASSGGFLVLSHEDSPWHAQHLFAVDKDVPGAEMTRLTGTFLTKVFDGPFQDAPKWMADLRAFAAQKGRDVKDAYLFYTTCPRCSKVYGHNYVVGFARVE